MLDTLGHFMPLVSSNRTFPFLGRFWLWNVDAPYSSVSNLLQGVWSVPECSAKDISILAKRVQAMDQFNTNPSLNDDEREKKLISMAYDHAEDQFRNGTASSQLTTHFLKHGSKKAELELKYAELQNQFLQERIASEKQGAEINQLFIKVMEALTSYQGRPEEEYYAND